jgi:hypothetical protein
VALGKGQTEFKDCQDKYAIASGGEDFYLLERLKPWQPHPSQGQINYAKGASALSPKLMAAFEQASPRARRVSRWTASSTRSTLSGKSVVLGPRRNRRAGLQAGF